MRRLSLTTWSLIGLVGGSLMGILDNAFHVPALAGLAGLLGPFGFLWLKSLRAMVLPLVITLLLSAIVTGHGKASVGRLTIRAFLLFVAMLAGAMTVSLTLAPPLIERIPVGPDTVASLRAVIPTSAIPDAPPTGGTSAADWIAGLLPTNLFAAAVSGEILPLLLFTVFLGLAIIRLPDEERKSLTGVIQGLAAAMFTLIRWVLWFMPFGVGVLAFLFTREIGTTVVGLLGGYVGIVSSLCVLVTLLLYPVSMLLGRVSFGAFARAAAPGQLVGLGTRSSIAALPALVQGGREHLRLPDYATGFVLPLGASLLKLSIVLAAPVNLLFLGRVFGIPIDGATMLTFLITVSLLSFGTAGIPGAGPVQTIPAYLAAGAPIEGIVILKVADIVPDIFKTALNATGYLSAATILSRSDRRRRRAEAPVPEPVPAA